MAFTSVAWANADIVTETKLDQMVASDEHVREEASIKCLASEAGFTVCDVAIAGTMTVQLSVDGSDYGSGDSGSGDLSEVNISLSGVSNGAHTIELTLTGSSTGTQTWTYHFYKTPDLSYVSWWATTDSGYLPQSGGNTSNYGLRDITIIGHRETKTWT